MSIATQLTALANNRDAIKAAIEAKGVADAGDTLAEFPAAIASIPSGGGDEWTPPSEWPNLREIMAADTEEYEYKMYGLFDTYFYRTVNTGAVYGFAKAVTSDGATYTGRINHTWSQDSTYGRFRWIAWYSAVGFSRANFSKSNTGTPLIWVVSNKAFVGSGNSYPHFRIEYDYWVQSIEIPSITVTDGVAGGNQSCIRMFVNASNLKKIPDTINITGATSTNAMFGGCISLKKIPDILDMSSSTDSSQMFNSCSSLERVPDILDMSSVTALTYMFGGCSSLLRLPDTINLTSVTSAANQSNAFTGCVSIIRLPTHVTSNWSLSFSGSGNIRDKDSVASFTNGAVTGGFVGNLNTCPNSGQTITLNSYIKGLFTAEEQAAIETAMSNKNWTLSW